MVKDSDEYAELNIAQNYTLPPGQLPPDNYPPRTITPKDNYPPRTITPRTITP